jgi:hypothetical protein
MGLLKAIKGLGKGSFLRRPCKAPREGTRMGMWIRLCLGLGLGLQHRRGLKAGGPSKGPTLEANGKKERTGGTGSCQGQD